MISAEDKHLWVKNFSTVRALPNFSCLKELADQRTRKALFVLIAISLLALPSCGGSDEPKIRTAGSEMRVYNQIFDESMMAGAIPKCRILEGQEYTHISNHTPPTGGQTWLEVRTDSCSGYSR